MRKMCTAGKDNGLGWGSPRKRDSIESIECDEGQYQTDQIAIIQKSDTAQVRVSRGIWNGSEVIDIRTWRRFKGKSTFVPTRKGITVDIRLREELIEALQSMSGRSK